MAQLHDVRIIGLLCCAFIERLRDEETFATVDALKAQMDRDSTAARAALAAARPEP